jgi:hypothetical protein
MHVLEGLRIRGVDVEEEYTGTSLEALTIPPSLLIYISD